MCLIMCMIYVCVYICISTTCVPGTCKDQRGALGTLEPNLKLAMNQHVSTGEQIQVLCKNSRSTEPLVQSISPVSLL